MKRILKNIVWTVALFTGNILVFTLIFFALSSPLDYFLDYKFPDVATDDLNLDYVLNNLTFRFWLLYYIAIAVFSSSIVFRSVSLVAVAAIFLNGAFFFLMRSNYEFTVWMNEALASYSGTFSLLLFLSVVAATLWLIIEILQPLIQLFLKDRLKGMRQRLMKWIRVSGITWTLVLSVIHFGSTFVHIVKTFG